MQAVLVVKLCYKLGDKNRMWRGAADGMGTPFEKCHCSSLSCHPNCKVQEAGKVRAVELNS